LSGLWVEDEKTIYNFYEKEFSKVARFILKNSGTATPNKKVSQFQGYSIYHPSLFVVMTVTRNRYIAIHYQDFKNSFGVNILRDVFVKSFLFLVTITSISFNSAAHSTEKQFLEYVGKPAIDTAQQIAEFYAELALQVKK
jgi:hypothetical protein